MQLGAQGDGAEVDVDAPEDEVEDGRGGKLNSCTRDSAVREIASDESRNSRDCIGPRFCKLTDAEETFCFPPLQGLEAVLESFLEMKPASVQLTNCDPVGLIRLLGLVPSPHKGRFVGVVDGNSLADKTDKVIGAFQDLPRLDVLNGG